MTDTATPPQVSGGRTIGAMTGTWQLVRLAARRDRVIVPVWLLILVGLLVVSVASVVGLYATEADRLRYATVAAGNAVARAFDGPMAGTSVGAITMTEVYGFLAVLVGIMSVQAVVRHTRQEEEAGRAELVGSAVVGRLAPLTAALLVAVGANVVLGAAVTLTLLAFDLPVAGSLAAGLAIAGVGTSFAAVAAVTAQISSSQRGANGLGIAAIGVTFLLRAVGDALGRVEANGVVVVSAWPSWLSPIGWGQQVRAFGGDRWAVLLLFTVLIAVLVPLAYSLRARRDVGGAFLEVRPGPPQASRWLRTPLGLAWRLQRGVLLAWTVGLAVLSAAFGTIGDEAGELIGTSEELAAMLAGIAEADLVALFFAFFFTILSIAAGGFTVQALLRLRNEEVGSRTEPLLATPVSRTRWLLSHLTVAALGTVCVLVVSGLVAGIAHALVTGSGEEVADLVGAALVRAPAPLALGGFVVAVIGLAPRWSVALAWGALVLGLVLGQLGELLDLPQAVLNVSPFTHPPALPAQELAWTPVLVLLGVAVALALVGLAALRRRDVPTL